MRVNRNLITQTVYSEISTDESKQRIKLWWYLSGIIICLTAKPKYYVNIQWNFYK